MKLNVIYEDLQVQFVDPEELDDLTVYQYYYG